MHFDKFSFGNHPNRRQHLRAGCSQKADFSTSLGNPANGARFPFSDSCGGGLINQNRTFHLLRT
jgi:hypothetical protein